MFRYYRLPSNEQIINTELINIVEIIGNKFKSEYPKSRESVEKKGVRKILSECQKHDRFISKRQIKLFLKPYNNSETSKFPSNSFLIFKTVVEILQKEESITKICQKDFFKCMRDNGCHCRDRLVYNSYNLMRFNFNNENIYSEKNYKNFLNFNLKCNKSCK